MDFTHLIEEVHSQLLGYFDCSDSECLVFSNVSRLCPEGSSSSDERLFFKIDVNFQDSQEFSVFVKQAAEKEVAFYNCISGRLEGLMPKLYASFDFRGRSYIVIENVEGEHIRPEKASISKSIYLSSSIGEFNSKGGRLAESGFLRNVVDKKVFWVLPVSSKVKRLEKEILEKGRVTGKLLSFFYKKEPDLVEWFNSQSGCFLNHNDVKAENNIFSIDGSIRFIDFESLSLGPAGSSLRKFAYSDPFAIEAAVASYVYTLKGYGYKVDFDSVLKSMVVQQVYWGVSTGLRRNEVRRIEGGIRLMKKFSDVI